MEKRNRILKRKKVLSNNDNDFRYRESQQDIPWKAKNYSSFSIKGVGGLSASNPEISVILDFYDAISGAYIGSVEASEEGETATESDEGDEADKAENGRGDVTNGGGIKFGEADGHYKWGNGQPLYVDLDKLDFGDVKMSRFDNPEFFIEGHPGVYVRFETSDYVNTNQALVYGTIGIVKIGDNRIMAMPDTYNFDLKLQKGTFIRDAATILGKHYAGYGTPFPIYFRGTTTLP